MYVNARAFIERTAEHGIEVLLQVRDRPGEAARWELPGGRIEEFESIHAAMRREVFEETGLRVTELLGDSARTVSPMSEGQVECLVPFVAYQTLKGPVDSVGYYFRCRAEGELTRQGDGARNHCWVAVTDLERRFAANPGQFDWLTQGALQFYLQRYGGIPPAAEDELVIRQATPQDAAELARLRWEFSPDEVAAGAQSFADFRAEFVPWAREALVSHGWTVWVAARGERLWANLYVQRVPKVPRPGHFRRQWGYVTNVYTAPELRGQSIGSRMLAAVMDWGRQERLELLLLWPSQEAVRFYERAGFTPAGALERPL